MHSTHNQSPYFFHQRTEIDTGAESDEWTVHKVVGHRVDKGKIQFLTEWEGHATEEATWVEPRDILPKYNEEFVDYFKHNNLKLDIVTHLG